MEHKIETSEIWEKHFGDIPAVGLMDSRVEGFFEELNEVCQKEISNYRDSEVAEGKNE